MKSSKRGISLIVLVITIIVIVVLATAIIVNVVKNNPIGKASEARIKSDFSTMNDELALYIGNQYLKDSNFDPRKLNADSTTSPSVYDIITTLRGSRYEDYVIIVKGKIVVSDDMEGSEFINGTTDNDKERERVDSTSDLWDFDPTTGTINYYKGSKEQLNIENNTIKMPTHIDGVEVKILGSARPIFTGSMMNFYQISGEKLELPYTLQTIGASAFQDCTGFTGELIIPDSVTYIGDGAFYNCSGFTGELVIPKNVTYIGNRTFQNCSGFSGKITLLCEKIDTVQPDAFSNTRFSVVEIATKNIHDGIMGKFNVSINSNYPAVRKVILQDSVETIGDYAFQGMKALTEELIIPASVKTIGKYAFEGAGLTKVNIMGATTIGNYAFGNCYYITDITLPDTLTNIEDNAFSNCSSLRSISLPNSITNIKGYTFQNCTSLKDIYIPDSVISIDNKAFLDCTALDTVSVSSATTIDSGAFEGSTPIITKR